MRQFSDNTNQNLLAVSADEPALTLLEITHVDLPVPIRVVDDVQNVTSNGNEFIALPFEISLPEDVSGQIPQGIIRVDNVGRELTTWLEVSRGGIGAKCRIMQILRSDPDVIELDITLDLTQLNINNLTVEGRIGFVNILGQTGTLTTFTPTTAPGLW
jgi:hypothetical protein